MSCTWLLCGLILSMACSDGAVRSGTLALPGDADSLSGSADEQPTLVLRCEEGRVSAYLVMDRPTEDSDTLGSEAVRVDLDSTPPCADAAP